MTDLSAVGKRRRRAKAAFDAAHEAARDAAIEAAANGTAEAEIARLLGVDRMTVRKWLGKR